MEDKKEKLIAIVGTSAFHVLLIVFLLLAYLEAPKSSSLTEWGGVPVMFGNVPDAFGDSEPFGGGGTIEDKLIDPTIPDEPIAVLEEKSNSEHMEGGIDEPIATQNFEETIAIDEAKNQEAEDARQKAKVDEANAIALKKKEDAQRKAEEDARITKQKAEDAEKSRISNQMSGLFGNGSGNGSRGETEGTGTQGVPTGNASYGKTSGVGGWGTFDLGGRSLGSGGLVKPKYTVDDYGTVVVDIVVNPKGTVVEATIGRGTNTPSSTLKREAMRAARQTSFNEVTKVGNQKGKITYKFNLN